MPKKKIEPDEVTFPDIKEFRLGDAYDGETVVNVWCDGRDYEPETESYRPQYSYSIKHPKWKYVGNDIRGAANEMPNLDLGSQSLFAFLYASQESYMNHLRGAFTDGNHEMFPVQVNEWAHHYSDEIANISSMINLTVKTVKKIEEEQ